MRWPKMEVARFEPCWRLAYHNQSRDLARVHATQRQQFQTPELVVMSQRDSYRRIFANWASQITGLWCFVREAAIVERR